MPQLLLNGVVTGLLLSLPALALSLSFSVLRFANYAIGSYLTCGAYLVYLFNVLFGWPLWIAASIGALGLATLVVAIDYLAYRPLRNRSLPWEWRSRSRTLFGSLPAILHAASTLRSHGRCGSAAFALITNNSQS
jgi:hypothetical protein